MSRLGLAAAALCALGVSACGSSVSTSTVAVRTVTISGPVEAKALGPARGEGANRQPSAKAGAGVSRPVYHAAAGCGVERWAVKTGTDPAAGSVRLFPQDASVAQLASIAAPVGPTDRLAPVETTVWRVRATVTAIKMEADSDYHLALSDGRGGSMIAESPAPACSGGSVFSSQIAVVRQAIDQACPNVSGSYQDVSIPAELTGVGFFDRIHGQRGVAPNGVELHPLLSVTLSGRC